MTKIIVGSYETRDEALKAVEIYQLEGHRSSNIVIFTNEKHANSLEKQDHVHVKTDNPKPEEDHSMVEKIKETFSPSEEFELDTVEKLVDYGLTQEEAEKSLKDVQAGNIVVLADDELRMGH